MAVEIPADYMEYSVQLVRAGGLLEPILNGVNQNISRLGDRLQIDVTALPQAMNGDGMAFVSRLFDAADDEALIAWPNDGMPRNITSIQYVNGAVAANSTVLPIRNVPVGFTLKEGLWFSIIHTGRYYMHRVRGGDYAGAGVGLVTNVLIGPRLRVSLSNSDLVVIAAPKIQGDVLGDSQGWSQASGSHSKPIQFSVREKK